MRVVAVMIVIIAVLIEPAGAESVKDVIKVFGLVGTWSPDCSKDPLKETGTRSTYEIPMFGSATLSTINRIESGMTIRTKSEIQEAVRITEDKIKLINKSVEVTFSEGGPPDANNFKPLQIVIEKVGQKTHVIDSRRTDGSQTFIENGIFMKQYALPLSERCLN